MLAIAVVCAVALATAGCLMDEAGKVTKWTGGGLHGPVKPGNARSPAARCFVLMKMTPQGFVIDRELTRPNQDIFNCSPENQIDLPGFPKS